MLLELPANWDLEVFKTFMSLVLLFITWTLGRQLLSYWEDRQRLKEASLELRQGFHAVYGEFKSLVRMWNILGRPATASDYPELVRDVVNAEGRLETLLTNVCSLKLLEPDEITTLGLFRQGYQTIRQAITKGEVDEVPYNYKQAQYQLFNDLMIAVSRSLLVDKKKPKAKEAQENLKQITAVRSAEWKKAVILKGRQEPWESLIRQVTKMRLE